MCRGCEPHRLPAVSVIHREGTSVSTAQYPARARVAAWAVHILTMSGLVWASLAMLATINPHRKITWMWVWLLVALVVDGVDGTLARRARVSEIIPWFDGGIVDIVVDYLTWTFIPAVFMYVALPMGGKPVAGLLMALILSSSMFCYANKQWKSTDYYFVGFPAAWNIVALMFYVLQTPAVINIIVTLVFVVLTLVPTHYAHPARVKRFRALNIGAVVVWFLATCWLVAIYPQRPLSLVAVIVVSGGWFLLAGVLRSLRGAESEARPCGTRS